MAKALHACEYLDAPKKHPAQPVCVVFGNDAFLQGQVVRRLRDEVLGTEDGSFSLSTFDGTSAALADVLGELATLAMFGSERRLVLVEKADALVTRYRSELEDYVAQPSPSGVLVLQVQTWPANTRLYKAVAAGGLAVDCSMLAAGRLTKWLGAWARRQHQAALEPAAAEALVEMVGPELGLLDQQLSCLALAVGPKGKITTETVMKLAGTWRAKTAWEMLDAALAGNSREALVQLDRLLLAGENSIAVLAQISASLRRLAAATRLVLRAEASRRRIGLRAALQQAGVRPFVVAKSEGQLRKLGRHRGAQLYDWLLEADLALKGASALPPRLVLERLIVRLASPELAKPAGVG